MNRDAIEQRIMDLQKMRWNLVCNPEWSEQAEKGAAVDWLTSTISEHVSDLNSVGYRKAG